MAEPTNKTLRVVVVTPERAVVDEKASFVVLPLYDGEFGVQPGHSAFVGQLGPGELRLKTDAGSQSFFIEGGFAQVRGNEVNVLTPKATAVSALSRDAAAAAKAAAEALPATTPIERETRSKATARANAMSRLTAKSGAA